MLPRLGSTRGDSRRLEGTTAWLEREDRQRLSARSPLPSLTYKINWFGFDSRRLTHRLSAAFVRTASPGFYCDGHGLNLRVDPSTDFDLHVRLCRTLRQFRLMEISLVSFLEKLFREHLRSALAHGVAIERESRPVGQEGLQPHGGRHGVPEPKLDACDRADVPHRPKRRASLANGFVGHDDSSFGQQILNIPEAHAVSVVEPDGMADDFGRKAMPMVAGPASVHPGIVPGGELT